MAIEVVTPTDIGAGLQIVGGELTANLTIDTADIYAENYAARSADGTTQDFGRNASITRTAAGQWTVALAAAHPDGANYVATLTAEEQSANRDTPDITIVQGSQTANGFNIQIVTGDNGGTADVYVDTPWSFSVCAPVTVVTGVTPA